MNKLFLVILLNTFLSVYSQQKYAFLMGISDYGNKENVYSDSIWCNIHGTNDIDLLAPTLSQHGFSITSIKDKNATAKNIRNKITKLISKVKDGDIVYLHFSCHGQPFEDLSGDEEDGWDEALVPVDAQMYYKENVYQGENHILDDELNSYFIQLRRKAGTTGFVFVVIDACHAGSSYRGDDEDEVFERGTRNAFSKTRKLYRPRINTASNFKIEKGNEIADICVLEACRSYQVNREIKENGSFYGPLSFYINEQLKEITLSSDISWIEQVKSNMDRRLVGQNMVVESSK